MLLFWLDNERYLFECMTNLEYNYFVLISPGVKTIIKGVESVPRDQAQAIQKKLEKCRNQENNPDSDL